MKTILWKKIHIIAVIIGCWSIQSSNDTAEQLKSPAEENNNTPTNSIYTIRTTAVLDRIEDGTHAVILLEDLREEIILPLNQLPPHIKENTPITILVPGTAIATGKDNATDDNRRKMIGAWHLFIGARLFGVRFGCRCLQRWS
ncbi:Protein of unknown function [Oceanobacillus limi]|uniref:Uncharacterized protein n=1 Tax=Oceanobacillus limi TaxID=930131 RepID=A0A1I0AGK9_9BACI|nr:Protein of unknown function [Oceanobacillus limi]